MATYISTDPSAGSGSPGTTVQGIWSDPTAAQTGYSVGTINGGQLPANSWNVGGPLQSGLTPEQFKSWLTAYYQSKGRTLDDQGYQTWQQYYDQFGSKDPAYLTQRLDRGLAGQDGGGSGFGAGGFGSGTFQMPGADQLANYPGYQYSIDEALRGLQSGAAAKGTLLNGRTQEAIGKSLAGYTAGVAYPQLFNQALQTHQTQFGDLYNVASLGKPT